MNFFKFKLGAIFLFASFTFNFVHVQSEESSPYTIIEDHAKLPLLAPALTGRKVLKIRLANKLEAILISDPKAEKSAAALAVGVGSWDEPVEYPGLAHFLEHMLFMGTKKYPIESEYDRFIKERGGTSNAYTSCAITSYMFSIDHASFPEALDRFSYFFKEPLFNPSGVSREMHAVDQEHAKSLDSDEWRSAYVMKELANPDHPVHNFDCGNLQTLSTVSQQTLKAWYYQNYSANLMHLIIYSPLPIDRLTHLAVSNFQDIVNIDAQPDAHDSPMLANENLGSLIYIEPIQDVRKLTILWELPQRFTCMQDSQPDLLIGHVLGHEGPESLLAQLKREKLAEKIKTGVDKLSVSKWVFQMEIELTEEGVRHVNDVIERSFQAIARLKEIPLPRYIFDEMQKMAQLNYQYQPHRDAFAFVYDQTKLLKAEPLSTYPEKTFIIQQFDPDAVADLIGELSAGNAQYYLLAPQKISGAAYDRHERWMGVQYTVKAIDPEVLEVWNEALPHPQITLPAPNPFIPTDLTLDAEENSNHPRIIVENDQGRVYFANDTQYLVPQSHFFFQIKTPSVDMCDAAKTASADLYVRSVREALADTGFQANLAGLKYGITRAEYGINIVVDGFGEYAGLLLQKILTAMQSVLPSAEEFAIAKDALTREYLNSGKHSSYQQAQDLFKATVVEDMATDSQKVIALDNITYEQFCAYAVAIFSQNYVEGFLFGDLSHSDAMAISANVFDAFDQGRYPEGRYKTVEVLAINEDSPPLVKEAVTAAQGNAVILAIQPEDFSFKSQAVQLIIMQAIKSPFFATLRTQQQTGYIVKSFPVEIEQKLFNLFAVQSNTHGTRDLLERFEAFIADFMQNIRQEITEERFHHIRRAMTNAVEQPPKDLLEMGARLHTLAFKYQGRFDWFSKRAQALKDLTYEEFVQAVETAFSPDNPRRIAILLDGVSQRH